MKDWVKSALLSSAIILVMVWLAWLAVGLYRYEKAIDAYCDESEYAIAYNRGVTDGYFEAVDVALDYSVMYALEYSSSILKDIKMAYPSKPVMGDYIGR